MLHLLLVATCNAYLVLGVPQPRFTALPPSYNACTNWGTPQYNSPFNQIKAVAHLFPWPCQALRKAMFNFQRLTSISMPNNSSFPSSDDTQDTCSDATIANSCPILSRSVTTPNAIQEAEAVGNYISGKVLNANR